MQTYKVLSISVSETFRFEVSRADSPCNSIYGLHCTVLQITFVLHHSLKTGSKFVKC